MVVLKIVLKYKTQLYLKRIYLKNKKLLKMYFFHMLFIVINTRSPYNGRLSDVSFYIESQISVHRKFKK